ncbi:MAG: hypothetical protein WD069_09520 [Planctomycetales bacterium]
MIDSATVLVADSACYMPNALRQIARPERWTPSDPPIHERRLARLERSTPSDPPTDETIARHVIRALSTLSETAWATERVRVEVDVSVDPHRPAIDEHTPAADWSGILIRANSLLFLADNWDGYGAPAPNERASSVLRLGLSYLIERNLFPTAVLPTAEGGIAMTFRSGERFASIEFLNDGDIVALMKRDDRPESPEIFCAEVAEVDSVMIRLETFLEQRERGPTPPAG